MLRRRIMLALATIALLSTAFAESAWTATATPGPVGDYVQYCPANGDCVWIPRAVAEHMETTTKPGKPPVKSITRTPERVCMDGGAARACTSGLGNWSNSQQCYLRRL